MKAIIKIEYKTFNVKSVDRIYKLYYIFNIPILAIQVKF
jgi:hypothetical protein